MIRHWKFPIFKTSDQRLLIGGGVFGSGYIGVLDLDTHIEETLINEIDKLFGWKIRTSILKN